MAKKGNGIFLVFTDVDPKHEEEFNAWYNTEHLGDESDDPLSAPSSLWEDPPVYSRRSRPVGHGLPHAAGSRR